MSLVPKLPDDAPFTVEQRTWLNDFLAGVLSRSGTPADLGGGSAASPPDGRATLLILFGTHGGNAEALARRLEKEATRRGFQARAAGMDSINAEDLIQERQVLIVTSTREGHMPDNALNFWSLLNQNGSSPRLNGVTYSVLALGDRRYAETFCLAGRRLDERLAELGAHRIHPRVECDLEYDAPAQEWSQGVFTALQRSSTDAQPAGFPLLPGLVETGMGYSKKNPFPARLLENRLLNSRGSSRDTRHLVFSLRGSGFTYEPGDSLGVYPQNCPGVVDQIIAEHGLSPQDMVPLPGRGQAPLREALLSHYEVRLLLGTKPAEPVTAEAFVQKLGKLRPRLFSISSSALVHPEEVHLTVSALRYEEDGVQHKGVATTYLADRIPIGGTAGVFIHRAPHFQLPAEGGAPVIMVCESTGIAPFRAFLENRQATGANGGNWLFFGDRRRSVDYLYQAQLEEWALTGFLQKLSLAFSHDQEERLGVHHLMLRQAGELWAWLEGGAGVYISGDSSRMAREVEAALLQIIQEQGGKNEAEAVTWLAALRDARRYQRDIYDTRP